jgi:hypothetical protein
MSGPSLSYIYVGSDGWIFAQFDQPIYFDGSTLDGFTIWVNGTHVDVDNSYIWGAGGDNRLSFGTTPPIQNGDSVAISYSGNDLYNLNGEAVQSFMDGSVMNMTSPPMSYGPSLSYVYVGGDGWIFAQFDQPIYFDGSTLDGFTIMVNGSPVNVDNSYIWGAGGDNRLSFGTIPPIQSGDSVEISYSGSDLHNLS